MKTILTEVCADSWNSAIAAEKGGCDRIELCQALSEDGLTPSPALISRCCKRMKIPVFVLIRPRAGDFCYNEEEFEIIKEDILFCKSAGAAGVVIGFLNSDGGVDKLRLREAVNLAGPMKVTFHRAFDRCLDWEKEMEGVIECGCDRILTSGQQETADKGKEALKKMVEKAGKRITILAGSGITPENVIGIVNHTNVSEVHFSAKDTVKGCMGTSHVETSDKIVNKIVTSLKSR